MPLFPQIKVLNTFTDVVMGTAHDAFFRGCGPKPTFPVSSVPPAPLPRSTPEAEGLDSTRIEAFFREVSAGTSANAHAVMIVRGGKVVSEGYFSPYRKNVWHVAHSLSKTFVGTAAGFAIHEGLFGFDDPITLFFPDKVHLFGSSKYKGITIRHLLNMTSGITFNEISAAVEPDWLDGIFSYPLAFEPGSKFAYNSLNSYLLAAIIQKTSGQPVLDYLRPRLFDPMGFGPVGWESCSAGINKGGWGMYLTLEDMAKFGQLYLQMGRWTVNGETVQLLPEAWVQQATTVQSPGDERDAYGYQLWVDPKHQCYLMNGLFGQYIMVCPRLSLVIAMSAGSSRLFTDSPAFDAMCRYFLDVSSLPDSLPPSPVSLAHLNNTLQRLAYRQPIAESPRLPARRAATTREARWNLQRTPPPLRDTRLDAYCNTTWRFQNNRAGILPIIQQAMDNNFSSGLKALRLERRQNDLFLLWEEYDGTICLPLGVGHYIDGTLRAGEAHFLVSSKADLRCNEVDEPVLVVQICFLEHSSCRVLKLQMEDENLHLRMDEHPQFSYAIEKMLAQETETAKHSRSGGKSKLLGDLFSNEFLHGRILQLCMPDIVGTPM